VIQISVLVKLFAQRKKSTTYLFDIRKPQMYIIDILKVMSSSQSSSSHNAIHIDLQQIMANKKTSVLLHKH